MALTGSGRSWSMDAAAFERLLAVFDADRDRAARRYEEMRRRLSKLFVWRGCTIPDECVDRTIDRVARKLLEGAEIHVADPYQYFHGVAVNVLREYWRDRGRADAPLDETVADPVATPEIDVAQAHAAEEIRLGCLDRCLGRLMPAQRDLLLEYHAGDRHIERRRALTQSLGIPLNALRIRVHRLRGTVERCVAACTARASASAETQFAADH